MGKKKKRVSSIDASSNIDESNVFCFVCIESFKNSRLKEFWIQYVGRQFRTHEACTVAERNGFYTCKTALPISKYRRQTGLRQLRPNCWLPMLKVSLHSFTQISCDFEELGFWSRYLSASQIWVFNARFPITMLRWMHVLVWPPACGR